ncbi:hypothetical protein KXR87_18945 [Yokenella regensburgei]|uniref:hypothetical protein n=1 Tax=Yokenella regensburgei TaxID=158877 RepID=UPI003F184C73
MLKHLFLFLILISNVAFANTVACSADSGLPERTIHVPLGDIKASASMSLYNQPIYIALYTYRAYFIGNTTLNCSSSNGQPVPASRQVYISPPTEATHGVAINSAGYPSYVFPTSVRGIGVSFDYSSGASGIPDKSASLTLAPSFDINQGYSGVDRVDITLWATPEFKNNNNADGRYQLNDSFTFTHAITLNNGGDNFSSVPYPDSSIANGWAMNRVKLNLNGVMEVQNGTCNFQSKTVPMGNHPVESGAQPSAWRDASFTVTCPAAWGRGAIADYNDSHGYIGTAEKFNEWGFSVMVIPRTDVIDNSRGIIGLKNGGASGYGIQLAWGKPSAQLTSGEPANPVAFNALIYGMFIPDIGFPMFDFGATPQQEFALSARYVRLPVGVAAPGAADASIEVIVTYL